MTSSGFEPERPSALARQEKCRLNNTPASRSNRKSVSSGRVSDRSAQRLHTPLLQANALAFFGELFWLEGTSKRSRLLLSIREKAGGRTIFRRRSIGVQSSPHKTDAWHPNPLLFPLECDESESVKTQVSRCLHLHSLALST